MRHGSTRSGTILIIVAGISALLASLSLTFLLRIRDGAQSSLLVERETQARLMLHAACAYVLEAGRIGYGPSRSDAQRPAGPAIDRAAKAAARRVFTGGGPHAGFGTVACLPAQTLQPPCQPRSDGPVGSA